MYKVSKPKAVQQKTCFMFAILMIKYINGSVLFRIRVFHKYPGPSLKLLSINQYVVIKENEYFAVTFN